MYWRCVANRKILSAKSRKMSQPISLTTTMKPTKKSYDIDSCSRPNEIMKSPALRKSKYYYINTGSFCRHNICAPPTHRWQLRKKTNCLLHFQVLILINFSMNLSLAARSVLLISKRQYTVCCPVSGHLKQN